MKLIIYGLTIIVILPLFYLGRGKKQLRLILGVSILAIAAAGLFFPGEITFSILAREIKKESKIKAKKTDDIINNAANQKTDSENQEKIELAKSIVQGNKKVKESEELREKEKTEENFRNGNLNKLLRDQEKQKGVRKGSQEKFLSALLFCGEEFNDKLASKEYEVGGMKDKSKIETENVIDFANYQNSKPEEVKEKIFDIIKKAEGEKLILRSEDFSIVGFKNIDKITNQELQKLLLEIFDPQTNSDFWKYKDKNNKEANPDLLRLIFVVTTSTSNPKISDDLRTKLNHVEPFLDKYFWTILLSSTGVEIIIFALLIKNKKKNESKEFEKLSH